MFLAPENVPFYLAERDLLSLKSVVDGDFTVSNSPAGTTTCGWSGSIHPGSSSNK